MSWFEHSSGRASASVTSTLSSGRSISSAIIIATAVVIPWPTSARGRANDAVPSGFTVDGDQAGRRPRRVGQEVGEVVAGRPAWAVGIAAWAGAAARSSAAATSVGAAIR